MAADNGSVGIKFEINGGQEVVKGINQVGNALNMLNERLKTNKAELNNWGATSSKLEQYEENLRAKLELLSKGVQAGTSRLKQFTDAEGNITRDGLKLKATLEKWTRAEQETTQELNNLVNGLYVTNKEIGLTENAIDSLENEFSKYSVQLENNKYNIDLLNKSKDALNAKLEEEQHLQNQTVKALEQASKTYALNTQDLREYEDAYEKASISIEKTKNDLSNLDKTIRNLDYRKAADGLNQLGNFASSVGQAFQLISTVSATALKSAVSNTIDYESAFAGVKKTADDTEVAFYGLQKVIGDTETSFDDFVNEYESGSQRAQEALSAGYNKIKKDLEALATVTASSVEDIMQVAEYAGQLGIPANQIAAFTEVVVKMGDSTAYGTEEAALSLARLGNVLMDSGISAEESAEWYNRLGAVIVDLGNNAAALEPEIGNVLQRIAAVGKQSKFTTAELAALSTALVSTGIKQEAGGTALMNTIGQIEKAVSNGGESLQNFARVAGMSAQEFAVAWKTEPMKGMQAVLKGLQKLSNGTIKTSAQIDDEVKKSSKGISKSLENVAKIADMTGEEFKAAWKEDKIAALKKYQEGLENVNLAGENAITVLEDLGIKSKRQTQAVLSLAASEEQLEEYLKRANEEWEKAEALNVEAAKRYETLEASISQMREAWHILGSVMGESITPIIKTLTEAMRDLASYLIELPKPVLAIATGLLGVTATIAPLANQVASLTMAFSGLLNIASSDTDSVFKKLAQKLVDPFKDSAGKIAEAGNAAEAATKTGFLQKITKSISESSSGISKALEWAFAPFKNIGKFFGELFKGLGTTLSKSFAPIVTKMGEFAKLLLSPFTTVLTNLGRVFSSEFGLIASKLAPVFNILKTALGFLGTSVAPVLAVAGAITLVVGAIAQLGGGADAVSDSITKLANKITVEFFNFANKLPEILSDLGETISDTAPAIFESIITALSDTMPKLVESGAEVLITIAEAITNNLPTIIESAVSIISTLLEALIEHLPELIVGAVKLVGALVKGIVKALPDILEAGGKIIGKLVEALTEGLVSLGKAGLKLANKVLESIEKAWDKVSKIGENLITGIVNGITAGWEKLKEKVQGVVESIKEKFTGKEGFDEHSPSKWAEQVGVYVDEGLANGFKKSKNKVLDSAKSVVDGVNRVVDESFSGIVDTTKLKVVEAAKEIENKLKKAADFESIKKNADKAVKKLNKSLSKAIKDLPKTYFKLGKESGEGLAKSIYKGASSLSKYAKKIAKATVKSLDYIYGDFDKAGKVVIKNFKKGMNSLRDLSVNDFKNTVQKAINSIATKDNKTQLNKAGTQLTKAFKDSVKKETAALIEEADRLVSEATTKANEAYEAIIKKQVELYNKMSDTSSLFKDDRLPTLTALERETALVIKYGEQLNQLKGNIPDSLMQMILSKDVETGLKYTNSLLSMSEAQLKEYVEAIYNLEDKSLIASANYYYDELEEVEKQFNKDIDAAMEKLKKEAEKYGTNVVKGLAEGMKSNTGPLEGAAKKLAKTITKTLKSELKIKSPSKVTEKIGDYSVDGIVKSFNGYGVRKVNAATEKLSDSLTVTLLSRLKSINYTINKKIITSIKDIGRSVTSQIELTVNNIANTTRNFVSNISSRLIDNLTNSVSTALGSGIDTIESLVTDNLTKMFNSILEQYLPDTGNDFTNALYKIFGSIGTSFISTLLGGFASDAKNDITSIFSNISNSVKTGVDNLLFAISNLFSKYGKSGIYANSYYFGESIVAGITDGIKDTKKQAFNSVLGTLVASFAALSIARNIAADKALANNNKIITNAQTVTNTVIDYDRLADAIGDRNIYLGERLVGRELRNMGVQFV